MLFNVKCTKVEKVDNNTQKATFIKNDETLKDITPLVGKMSINDGISIEISDSKYFDTYKPGEIYTIGPSTK